MLTVALVSAIDSFRFESREDHDAGVVVSPRDGTRSPITARSTARNRHCWTGAARWYEIDGNDSFIFGRLPGASGQ